MQTRPVRIDMQMSESRGLTEQQARCILNDLKKVLICHGIWHTIWETNEPDLKRVDFKGCIVVGK